MLPGERTLSGFVHGEERRSAHGTGGLAAHVEDVALAAARIAEFVGKGALAAARRPAGATNASGDAPQPLAAIANEIFVRATHGAEALPAALASGQTARPHPVASELRRGRYLLLFEALDAAPDIEANAPAGSIFSVLRATDGSREPAERDFLQPGTDQVCAGYAIYGPATMLVLTFGRGVHAFTLDRARGEFVHTHPDLRIPQKTPSSRPIGRTRALGSRRCGVMSRRASRQEAARGRAMFTCAAAGRWSPRRIASSCTAARSSRCAASARTAAPGGRGCSTKRTPSAW